MHIPGFRGVAPYRVVREAIRQFIDDDMTTYASALAYQVLFSIFPFVIFLIALLGFLHLEDFFVWLRNQAALMLPEQAMKPVNDVIDGLQKKSGGLLSFGVVLALWTASAAVRAIMNAMNAAYQVKETRPLWKRYPLSLLYTVALASLLIIAAALLIVGPQAMQWLAQLVGLGDLFVLLWTWLRGPVALLLLMMVLAFIYYAAPNARIRFRFITPGAVLAVIVWIAASAGFKYYVSNFANYNATYGSIGTIVVLLLYFFISASVLLFGAEVNAAIERQATE